MADLITAATFFCCAAICLRLLTYRPRRGARHRRPVALLAWLLVVATGGNALLTLLFGARAPLAAGQLVVLAVLLLIIHRARGNLARLLPED